MCQTLSLKPTTLSTVSPGSHVSVSCLGLMSAESGQVTCGPVRGTPGRMSQDWTQCTLKKKIKVLLENGIITFDKSCLVLCIKTLHVQFPVLTVTKVLKKTALFCLSVERHCCKLTVTDWFLGNCFSFKLSVLQRFTVHSTGTNRHTLGGRLHLQNCACCMRGLKVKFVT